MDRICRIIDFQTIDKEDGSLSVVEGVNLPFQVKRIFYIYKVPFGYTRGEHSLINGDEIFIPISGSFEVIVRGAEGPCDSIFPLYDPRKGLFVPAHYWREVVRFSEKAVCLVLCSTEYTPSDYIYSKDFFPGPRD